MKKIIISILLITSLFLVACAQQGTPTTNTNTNQNTQTNTNTATNNDCKDDDAKDLYTKGITTDKSNKPYTDNCVDLNTVKEYLCVNGAVSSQEFKCADGESCKDGVCIKVDANTAVEGCTDSDGGLNQYVKGYVIDKSGAKYPDSCMGSLSVNEARCGPMGFKDYAIVQCEQGYMCQDAICVKGTPAESTCKDSDLLDPYTKGTVTDPKGSISDECSGYKTVIEYRCGSAGYRDKTYINCETSCVDGACTK